MSVARCREINARLRAASITVHEYPGCWTRGNGLTPAYEGGTPHHTASAFGIALPNTAIGKLLANGRADLDGPLCNYAGNDDGSVTFIAAFPANHAGASGGRSMGPLPTTRLFNPRVLGLEIVYPGTVPMRTAQYRTALIWSRIVADVVGYANIQRIRAHAETSITGKWDPGQAPNVTINMPAFRTAAAVAHAPAKPPEDDMATPAETWGYNLPGEPDMRQQLVDAREAAEKAQAIAAVNQQHIYAIEKDVAAILTALATKEN